MLVKVNTKIQWKGNSPALAFLYKEDISFPPTPFDENRYVKVKHNEYVLLCGEKVYAGFDIKGVKQYAYKCIYRQHICWLNEAFLDKK